MESPELAEGLELLVDRLEQAGSPIRSALRPPRPRAEVARHFYLLGLHPIPELVDLFAWHDGADGADLFWRTNFHPLGETTESWRRNQTVFEWFPALYRDGSEFVVIDNTDRSGRGSVWFTVAESEPEWLFDSLLEGVLAAVWCVEQGLWRPDGEGSIRCDRHSGPSRKDRNYPPWS